MDVFFGFIKWIEDWKKEDIDYMSNCTLVLVGVTLVSVVALYYFGIRYMNFYLLERIIIFLLKTRDE
jgi:hypothetical protein